MALLGIRNADLNSLFYYHLILGKIYCNYRSITSATKIKAFHMFLTLLLPALQLRKKRLAEWNFQELVQTKLDLRKS